MSPQTDESLFVWVQTLTTIAAFSTGVPANATDQTTAFTHDGNGDEITETAVMPPGTPSQTTASTYGVTTGGGSTINSNSLLAKTEYPDPTTGNASTSASNDVSYTVDSLGDELTMTDQNGTTHTYTLDPVGRETCQRHRHHAWRRRRRLGPETRLHVQLPRIAVSFHGLRRHRRCHGREPSRGPVQRPGATYR